MDKTELQILQESASGGSASANKKLVDYYLSIDEKEMAYLAACRFEYLYNADGYRTLGMFYLKGIGTTVNLEKAKKFFAKAYQLGDIDSGYNLALILNKENRHEEMIDYLTTGVSVNHIPSIKLLAGLYLNGNGISKSEDIAINLLLKAIELGDLEVSDKLALLFYKQRKYDDAFKYFQIGADNKNTDSIYHLALCYAKGLGTKQDFVMARQYYQMGANLSEPRCLYNLALYYRQGIGVEPNLELAEKLEKQAYECGLKKPE